MFDIGIMQGRLLPPAGGKIQSFPKLLWRDEFKKAKNAGLTHIEWIFEQDEWEKNPISYESGILEIIEEINSSKVKVYSVCADYFMDNPYFVQEPGERKHFQEKLIWLVSQSLKIGARYMDIPFVDASSISSRDQYALVKELVLPAAEYAQKHDFVLALETSLSPSDFKELLEMVNHPNIMANYDTGNSSGIGYNCTEELNTYGKWIRTLHIKDRLLNNGTKPLGQGSADFKSFFKSLAKLKYNGPIVLQAARERNGEEVETAIKNKNFVVSFLSLEYES